MRKKIRPVRVQKKAFGFTLIELAIVVLLISVLVGLSTPLFRRTFSDIELKNSSYDIAKLINYAQETAVIEKANYRMNFDTDRGKYWLTKLDLSEESPRYKRLKDKYGRVFSAPEGSILRIKHNEITLYPNGRSDAAELVIANKNQEGYVLRVKGSGSNILIERFKGEER